MAHYSPSERGIRLDIEEDRLNINHVPYKTTFHESGHFIDKEKGKINNFSVEYGDEIFEKTLRQEANDYLDKMLEEMRKAVSIKGISPEILTRDKVYSVLSERLKA